MFKKILQSLSRAPSGRLPPAPAPPEPPKSPAPPAKPSGILDKIAKGAPLVDTAKSRSPEELCEISAKMSPEDIQARLKLLYRRYNHSASSLDAKTRAEADKMLDAIVAIREKHFGKI